MNTYKKQKGLARFSVLSALFFGFLFTHTSVFASSEAKQAGVIVSSDESKQFSLQNVALEIPQNLIHRSANTNQESVAPTDSVPRLLIPMGPVKDAPKMDVEQNTSNSAKEIPTNFVRSIEQKENAEEDIPREVPRSKRHPVNIYDIQEKPVIKKEAASNSAVFSEAKQQTKETQKIQTKSSPSKLKNFFKKISDLFS